MCDPRGWTRGSGITLALVAGLAAAACGGSGGSTPAPSPTPSPGSTTITITASGRAWLTNHIREQRLEEPRHGVGSAPGAHAVP
jgi:ABC-type glycerol-3-phosphate transport system substrate-binding protein